MKDKIEIFIIICGLAAGLIISRASAEQPYFGGYVRNYTGILTEDFDYSIIQNTFELDIRQTRENVGMRVQPYVYQYPGKTGESDFGLRQAYMDLFAGPFDLRVGKQQVIWGKANGVFVTDIVSPKDYSEFILPDFEEVRLGINSVRANYYRGNRVLELVWVPIFTPDNIPDEDSIWSRDRFFFPVDPVYDSSEKEVENNLKNSEVFARFSSLGRSLDVELVGGYKWQDTPTLHMEKTVDPATSKITSITITPEYHRLGVFGGSFSTDISGYVLTGEGAYYSGEYFLTKDSEIKDGVDKKNYLHYMLGLDKKIGRWNVNIQYIQKNILDYDSYIKDYELTDTATFMINSDFFNNKLLTELFIYYGVNDKDYLLRPKLNYEFDNGFELIAGVDSFGGDEGKFGEFSGNDMGYTKFKYSF